MKHSLGSPTVAQLTRAIGIREKIEELTAELQAILGGEMPAVGGKRKMSAAGRAAIAAGARKRWAKARGGAAEAKPRRKMNAAARAKIAAAARARWKAAKAAGKTRL